MWRFWPCCCCCACCCCMACSRVCCWFTITWNWLALSCCSFFFISISFSRSAISLSLFSFKKSTASLPLLLFLLSFMSPPLSSWFFLFFVWLILSIACFRISSAVTLSFSFFLLTSSLFSSAAFSLSVISSKRTSSSSCSGDIPDARVSSLSFSLYLVWRRENLSLTALCERFCLNFSCWQFFRDWAISVHIFPASLLPFLCL